jgi:hypothetical protein
MLEIGAKPYSDAGKDKSGLGSVTKRIAIEIGSVDSMAASVGALR